MIMTGKTRSTTISLTITALLSGAYSNAIVQEIGSTEEFLALLQSGNPMVVKFYADYCGACRNSKAPFEEVSNEPEFADILFANVNTQSQQDVASQFNIDGIPTFIYFKGGMPVEKTAGMHPTMFKDNLRDSLRTNLSNTTLGNVENADSPEMMAQMDVAPDMPEMQEPQKTQEMPIQKDQDASEGIQGFFMKLFGAIKRMIMTFINWIKGLFA